MTIHRCLIPLYYEKHVKFLRKWIVMNSHEVVTGKSPARAYVMHIWLYGQDLSAKLIWSGVYLHWSYIVANIAKCFTIYQTVLRV